MTAHPLPAEETPERRSSGDAVARLSMAIVLVTAFSIPASAATITYTFDGTITRALGPASTVGVGSALRIVAQVDSAIPPFSTTGPSGFDSAAYGLESVTLELGGAAYSATFLATGNPADQNLILLDGIVDTLLVAVAPPSLGPPLDGLSFQAINFAIDDTSAAALSSTALPLALDISDFDNQSGSMQFVGLVAPFDVINLEFTFQSVSVAVPEPGVATLLGVVVSAVALTRRGRRRVA